MRGHSTFNFYDQSRIVIGRVINQYPTANKACKEEEEENMSEADFGMIVEEALNADNSECDEEASKIQEVLGTDKARKALQKLADAGLLNNNYMPAKSLSWSKKGELASLLAIELNIENTWKVFGAFWNVEPETLRSGYNKAREMRYKYEFDKKIMTILG